MKRSAFLAALTAAVAAIPAFAVAVGLESGLKPGQAVSPFHPRHIAGPLAGTSNCFACTFGDRPQVQVWVNGDDPKNVSAIAKTLGKAMKDHRKQEFKALVVFVTTPDTADAQESAARTLAAQKDASGLGIALIDASDEAVSNYRINTITDVKNTVMAYRKWAVTNSFVNLDADDKGAAKALDVAIDGITR